ncbi:MAG: DUF1697 domain-containing protein [Bacteroidia bacterium]|nr:DUF1697 domain-containing protein [Winogradskyella sp.]MBT8376914.1 DUF1697 domain-containing protein [Bacteroidia bacterium]NNF85073.1 DUF1697 domain-containing protein [Winogradskyella sp.]NNL83804.1 DUF1697 domain-containing protein [Winogradskyella sp.]
MKTYIALLRGINVGGHKKLPMADLRQLLETTDYMDVKTYIQSGNVVFKSSESSTIKIEQSIKNAIMDRFGYDVTVMVKTKQDLQQIFKLCPFDEDKKKASYFALFKNELNKDLIEVAKQKTYPDEEFEITDSCIYFYCANGYGRAKFNLNYFERLFKSEATARNYNTMVKLISMAEALEH